MSLWVRTDSKLFLIFGFAGLLACSGAGLLACSGGGTATIVAEVHEAAEETATGDVGEVGRPVDAGDALEEMEIFAPEDVPVDNGPDSGVPGCGPGDGCFGDGCQTNQDCQSGWCVQHLGENVCTMTCQDECPPGWACRQVAGTEPDVAYICVSSYANLCRPCATNDNCTSVGSSQDACLDYGSAGSFCGAPCGDGGDCPWGFTCKEVGTVEGSKLLQCVNDTGECPCTDVSVKLGLTTPCQVSNDLGACSGVRTCAADGLSPCDAATPSEDLCNGIDDDCDGEADEPALVGGDYVNLCDDSNDCTEDQCSGEGGCVNTTLDVGQCNDGNPCTVADHCVGGTCTGSPVECNDDNPCTEDLCTDTGGCDFPPQAGACDDGNPCTLADVCGGGVCTGTTVPCECQGPADCEALEDGNLCNGTLTCDTSWPPFECIVDQATVVQCPAAAGIDAFCLQPSCAPETGGCFFEPDHENLICDDGDVCTVNDRCEDGVCGYGTPVSCNDGNPCTDDSCDPAAGCLHQDNAASCSDGNVCTTQDACSAGQCVGGPDLSCDDVNPCTADSCDYASGCQHAASSGECDDGNKCTSGDHCAGGSCISDQLLSCEDENVCTDDSCDPDVGCVHLLNQVPCNDGNKCTVVDKCFQGACKGSGAQGCNDGNPCTDDECDPDAGCVHANNQAACNDANVCTTQDKCGGGKCTGGPALPCDDGNPCTLDGCGPATGCEHSPAENACDDGNACTSGDHCAGGSCVGQGMVDCDDDNVCTSDLCDPAKGCVHSLSQAPCDDGDLCTTGDKCMLGQCTGTGKLSCIDGNLCTDDSCVPAAGCQFIPNTAPCDDGNACTTWDICKAGWCASGMATDCSDGNDCTADACEPLAGCGHVAVVDGTPCLDLGVPKICIGGACVCKPDCAGKECGEDGCGGTCGTCEDEDACTLAEHCDAGQCKSTPLSCVDGNLCTDDTCVPATGCLFVNNAAPCDDGDACTANDACSGGACKGSTVPALAPWKFTNAGATGRFGPTQTAVNSAYAGTNLQGAVTVSEGIQSWAVPYTGKYTIQAAGAKGGDGGASQSEPGKGAVVSGDFVLQAGTTLRVIIGQMGHLSNQPGWAGAGCSGGGGGSWVYTDPNANTPLLVAAGGGGQAENATGGHGSGATSPTLGTGGSGNSADGGVGGNGGFSGPTPGNYTPGAGGGGWLSSGQDAPTIRNPGGKGGQAPKSGGQGGYGVHNDYGAEHCSGGFGGGGAGSDNTGAGGGGGGYNGGGGGRNYAGGGNWGAGGGGGSYNSGSNQVNQTGSNSDNGFVTITFECN